MEIRFSSIAELFDLVTEAPAKNGTAPTGGSGGEVKRDAAVTSYCPASALLPLGTIH
jgi:hypothetical protein